MSILNGLGQSMAYGAQVGWQVGCHMRDMLEERENSKLRANLNWAIRDIEAKRQLISELVAQKRELVDDYNELVDKSNSRLEQINNLRAAKLELVNDYNVLVDKYNSQLEQMAKQAEREDELRRELEQCKAQLQVSKVREQNLEKECAENKFWMEARLKWLKTQAAKTRETAAVAFKYYWIQLQLKREIGRAGIVLSPKSMQRIMSVGNWALAVFANSGWKTFPYDYNAPEAMEKYKWEERPVQSQEWTLSTTALAINFELTAQDLDQAITAPMEFDPLTIFGRSLAHGDCDEPKSVGSDAALTTA